MSPRLSTRGAIDLSQGPEGQNKNPQILVLGIYRPLRTKSAIPHPITIQNMRLEQRKKLVNNPFNKLLFEIRKDEKILNALQLHFSLSLSPDKLSVHLDARHVIPFH